LLFFMQNRYAALKLYCSFPDTERLHGVKMLAAQIVTFIEV